MYPNTPKASALQKNAELADPLPPMHGRRESNPQPPVLETGALPIELRPSMPLIRQASRIATRPSRKIYCYHHAAETTRSRATEAARDYSRITIQGSSSRRPNPPCDHLRELQSEHHRPWRLACATRRRSSRCRQACTSPLRRGWQSQSRR